MTAGYRSRYGAVVNGAAAVALASTLAQPEAIVARARAVGDITAEDEAAAREQFDAIRQASRAYLRWRASVGASTEVPTAEMAPPSDEEISATTAAEVLNLTPSRVRQLLRSEVLPGRKVAGTWLVYRSTLATHRDVRSAA